MSSVFATVAAKAGGYISAHVWHGLMAIPVCAMIIAPDATSHVIKHAKHLFHRHHHHARPAHPIARPPVPQTSPIVTTKSNGLVDCLPATTGGDSGYIIPTTPTDEFPAHSDIFSPYQPTTPDAHPFLQITAGDAHSGGGGGVYAPPPPNTGGTTPGTGNPGEGGTTPGSIPPVASNAPEPQAWSLMVAGFGIVGGAVRWTRPRSTLQA